MEQLVDKIIAIIDDKKGDNIKVIDLKNKAAFADTMIVATGSSSRQVGAIADYVYRTMKDSGILPHIEGVPNCEWVLIDGGDVIVHLFTPEMRDFYSIEKIWSF